MVYGLMKVERVKRRVKSQHGRAKARPYTSKMTEPDDRAGQPVNKGLGLGFLGAAAVMLGCWGVFDAAGFFGVEVLVGFGE